MISQMYFAKAFQSTLPRRERLRQLCICAFRSQFQSTLPRRERLVLHISYFSRYKISIHAPAKGATRLQGHMRETRRFQSTLPRRERRTAKGTLDRRKIFQSTLPRRERHARSSELWSAESISIHAPAKGATPTPLIIASQAGNFNPRSREGSDFHSLPLKM